MLGTYAWHHHQPHHAASMPCTTVPVVATRRHMSPPLMSNPSPSTTNIAVVYISVGILSFFLLEILGLLIANGRRCVFSCACVQLCVSGCGLTACVPSPACLTTHSNNTHRTQRGTTDAWTNRSKKVLHAFLLGPGPGRNLSVSILRAQGLVRSRNPRGDLGWDYDPCACVAFRPRGPR